MDTLLLKLSFHAFCFLFLTAPTSATVVGVTYTSPLTPPSSSAAVIGVCPITSLSSSSASFIGVSPLTWPPSSSIEGNASEIPPPPQLSHPDAIPYAVSALGFRAVRLSHPDPGIIRALAFTNVSLLISIENELLIPLASSRSVADDWLRVHVLPFYPHSTIAVISVGDDTVPILQSELLLPAIRNVDLALRDAGIKNISVTATLSFLDVVTGVIPPSLANFREPMGEQVIRPLLQFLEDRNSIFLVDLYPYKVSRIYSQIPLGFSLFHGGEQSFYRDFRTGITYHNMFDLMVDAVTNSLKVYGYQDITLVVAATGWPSSAVADDGSADPDATPAIAQAYLSSLAAHLKAKPERNQAIIPRGPATVSGRPSNWMPQWLYSILLVLGMPFVLNLVAAVLILGFEMSIGVAIRGLFN